jgi:hypothetical protein
VVSNHEFTGINSNLMKSDGSLLTSDSKSDLIHALEGLVPDREEGPDTDLRNTYVVVDGMAVVHEVISASSPKTCKDLGDAFARTIESRMM